MGRFFLILSICGLSLFAQAVTVRIAVIGDSPQANKTADMVLVKLSKTSSVELLERQRIEEVLKERKLQSSTLAGRKFIKLGKILHTDIFALIHSGDKKAVPVGLRIFDAKNGFIILDTALPSGDITSQSEFICKKLKSSLESMKGKLISIAVLTIRNAGVETQLFYKCIGLTANINRTLIASPNIAMLERTNLDMVNRERKIAEKYYDLNHADLLIDFEFLPMDSPEKIKLNIRIFDRRGKVLKTLNYRNIIQNGIAPKDICNDILAFLKAKPGIISSNPKQEAKRFYQEFCYIRRFNFDESRRNISAAIALEPKDLNYRRDFAYLLIDEAGEKISPEKDNRKYFKMLRQGLQLLSEIRKTYPDYHKKNLFSLKENVFNTFLNRYSSKKIPAELIECAKIFRWHSQNEMFKYYSMKPDNTKAFDSVKEIRKACNILQRSHIANKYLSQQMAIDAYFTDMDSYLDRSRDFFIKKPTLLKTISPDKQIYLGPLVMPVIFTGTTTSKLFFKTADKNRKIITKMKQHPLPIIKTQGALLELHANLYKDNFSVEPFKHDVAEYFKCLKMFFPSSKASINTLRNWNSWEWLGAYLSYQHNIPTSSELRIVLDEQGFLFMLKQNIYNIDNLFAHILLAKNNKIEFLKRVMVLEKLKSMKHVSSYDSSHIDIRLKMYMNEVKPILAGYGQDKLYDKLEASVGIRKVKPFSMVTERLLSGQSMFWQISGGNSRIIAAELLKNKVYFCYMDFKRIKGPKIFEISLSLASLDINTKSPTIISSHKGLLKNSRFGQIYNSLIYDGSFYLACREGVLVFPLDGGSPYVIDKLPAEYVYTVAGLNRRIYIAMEGNDDSNKNTQPSKLILISCKADGSDRKIIFSSLDRRKRNIFDQDKPFKIEYIWGDEKRNRLLILACKPFGGLWEFYPDTNKAKCLCNLSPLSYGWGKYMNGKLYFSMNNSVYFAYDLKNNVSRFLYSNKGEKSYYTSITDKYCKLKAETIQKNSVWFRNFYKAGNWLWYGHDWNMWQMNLNDPKNPIRLYQVRNTNSEFPILAVPNKKAVIAVSSNEIFYLGEKKGEQKIDPEQFKHPLLKRIGL